MDKNISFKFQFSIFSEDEYDVSAITNILQISPSNAYKKDEQYHENKYRKDSAWRLDSEEVFS
jgi:hypothetical protein